MELIKIFLSRKITGKGNKMATRMLLLITILLRNNFQKSGGI